MPKQIFLLSCVPLFSCAPKGQPVNTPRATPVEIKVAPFKGKLRSVSVKAAGKQQTFLFDTGGGVTVLTPAVAKAMGCKPSGRVTGFRMTGQRVDMPTCDDITLEIGGLKVHHATVGVMDINRLFPPGWPRVGGLISLQSFRGKIIYLELGRGRVMVLDWKGNALAPIRFTRQASGLSVVPLLPVDAAGRRLWFLLDSGCFVDGFIVAPHAARLLGHEAKLPVSGGATSTPRSPAAKIDKIFVKGPHFGEATLPALVKDIIYDGVICAPLINSRHFTLDLRGAR